MNENDFRDFRPDRKTTAFATSWLGWGLGIIVAFGIIIGAVNFIGGWLSQPAKVYGVKNVREQWAFTYDFSESLKAIQSQYCSADRAVKDAIDNVERSQRTSQRIAIENNYARVAAQYEATLANAFKAKLVRPADVPEHAPKLDLACSPN
jgi:hypothetical protein